MAAGALLPVADALARIQAALSPLPAEWVTLDQAAGRVLTEDLIARRTQPPVAVSAMDGYALRYADVAATPARLNVIGRVPAGSIFAGTVGPGEAARIFTGAAIPDGADTVVIQENTTAGDGSVQIDHPPKRPGDNIRPAGGDFREGECLLAAGRRLGARDVALAAGMGHGWLPVARRPRVAILATGDELKRPGEALAPGQIVASNSYGIAALVRALGGTAIDLGIAPDDEATLARQAAGAEGCDLLVTIGGASVGDHDLVQKVLGQAGASIDFWKIAMRPGKPLMFGRFGAVPLLGLPGNPVSAMICAVLFLAPALARLTGLIGGNLMVTNARLGRPLAANDQRQDYLRARLSQDQSMALVATPFDKQDSSMLSALSASDCFIVRPPHAPAAGVGDSVEIIDLRHGWF